MQLAVLLWRVGANDQTDTYLYLFNMGMLPTQIIIVGVVFPMLLNRERLTRRAATIVRHAVPALASTFVIGACAWMSANGRIDESDLSIVVASLINAFLQSKLWFRAVSAEASGDPNWISGIAIPANVLALLTLLLPVPEEVVVTAMVVSLAIGNAILLAVMCFRGIGSATVAALPERRVPGSRAEAWFLTKAGVSYGGLAVIQSLAVILPPAVLTLLSVAAKIVASVVATFVNAVMPRIVHQQSTEIAPSMRFLTWLYGGAGVIAAALVATAAIVRPDLVSLSICVGLWIGGAVSNAVAQRTAYRFLPPSTSRVTILVVPVVAILTVFSSSLASFQLVTLICAYAAVDAVTGGVLLIALRQRTNSAIALGIATGIALTWIWSLL